MEQRPSVFIHIVTWNSEESIATCLERAMQQTGFVLGESLFIRVTDNGSRDETVAIVERLVCPGVSLVRNSENLGFSGAHNQGVAEFLQRDSSALLVLNPDVGLEPNCVRQMCEAFRRGPRVGLVTPKLRRALPSLEPIYPHVLDAAGMVLTTSCRHFDRGAGEWDRGDFDSAERVFGATGACVLISRECASDLCIPKSISDDEVHSIYPQLKVGWGERPQLFDEAFFAYREDADLSWRANRRGWECWYEPAALGNHVRVVTPERRRSLPALLNRYSVRNRFLLQMNNWSWRDGVVSFILGVVIRNLVVIVGVCISERSSIVGLYEARRLARRAFSIRKWNSTGKRDRG
ncbi:MAG: glycosyltransferase [Pseudomonadota bacterium]|jgi:GT2 family glycosyltransferase